MNDMDEQEIILADLNDADLMLQMHDDLYDGLKEEIEEGVNIFLERKSPRKKIPSAIYYPISLYLQKTFKSLDFSVGDFPISEYK